MRSAQDPFVHFGWIPSVGKLSSGRCPSDMTPTVIQANAISRVGSDRRQATANRASGKQISSVERVLTPCSPSRNRADFQLTPDRDVRHICTTTRAVRRNQTQWEPPVRSSIFECENDNEDRDKHCKPFQTGNKLAELIHQRVNRIRLANVCLLLSLVCTLAVIERA